MFTKVDVPEGVQVSIEADKLVVKGPKGEILRTFPKTHLEIKKTDKEVEVVSLRKDAFSRALAGTFRAHIKNMILGVQKPYTYKLKICSSHFPINAKVTNQEIHILNFLGEKKPRKVAILEKVSVRVEGDIIIVEAIDKELAGQTAARIERATRVKSRDRRVFQDGIYIIEKAGKPIGK